MEAIYVRQSVDKKDSISIETQIEECKKKLISTDFEIFSDKGFSGKSTERPRFQDMLQKVRQGKISAIIIYKFDRISRSLMDFLSMQAEFSKNHVKMISCSEKFDTETPMGKAMLSFLMVFAQMERETIQQRIKDNYYARGEKGLYLGGPAPFGYRKIDTHVNGKKTYTFEENKSESMIVKELYKSYISGKSLAEIARVLNNRSQLTRKKKPWSSTAIARILKNPAYVRANADVYHYLADLGAHMTNPLEDYIGQNGCYVYGNAEERTGSKFTDLKNDYVSLGLHEGFIDPATWLEAQQIFSQKQHHSNLGTGSLTWLQGLIKCGCGYSYYVKRNHNSTKEHRYLYCRGRKNNTCPYPKTMVPVEIAEKIAEAALLSRLDGLKVSKQTEIVRDTPEINALKIQIEKIEKKINNLVEQVANGTSVTSDYLNRYIEKLHEQKQRLTDEVTKIELQFHSKKQLKIELNDILSGWSTYPLEIKKEIAKEVIEKIILEGNVVKIFYK